jgi:hypothetical protein
MPRAAKARSAGAAPTPTRLNAFLHHLGRTGSVTFAATRTGLRRSTLYKLKAENEEFAGRWAEALDLGVERLQDDAMRRALHGTERAVFRNGRQVGSVRQYDNRLLQFLLRAHRPETYGDGRRAGGLPPLPFDLAKRLAAARPRAEAHEAEKRAEEEARKLAEKNGD